MASAIRRHPGRTLAAVGTVGLLLSPLNTAIPIPNPFRTPGVSNIEDRFSVGGGTPSHTPAAASKLGEKDDVRGNVDKERGSGTKPFEEGIMGQRPEPGPFDKVWNKTQSGNERGK